METINDVLQKQLEKCNKIIEQAEKNKNIVIGKQQQLELSNSKVAEIQQQIEELHNKCNAELQRQEDLKQEIHTISQQICVDFNEPEPVTQNVVTETQPEPYFLLEPQLGIIDDNIQARKIQKLYYCYIYKKYIRVIPDRYITKQKDDRAIIIKEEGYTNYRTPIRCLPYILSKNPISEILNIKFIQTFKKYAIKEYIEYLKDFAARRLQRFIICLLIKKRRAQLSAPFVQEISRYKYFTLYCRFGLPIKLKTRILFSSFFYHIKYLQILKLSLTLGWYRQMNTFIAWSQNIVCKIPGCNAHIYSFQEKEHMERKHDLDSRKHHKVNEYLKNHSFEEECGICQIDKLNNGKNIIFMPCGHVFHESCINEWLKPKDNPEDENWNCPLCRKKADADLDKGQCNYHFYVRNSNIIQRRICYRKCIAEATSTGERCKNNAVLGDSYCRCHGGEWWYWH